MESGKERSLGQASELSFGLFPSFPDRMTSSRPSLTSISAQSSTISLLTPRRKIYGKHPRPAKDTLHRSLKRRGTPPPISKNRKIKARLFRNPDVSGYHPCFISPILQYSMNTMRLGIGKRLQIGNRCGQAGRRCRRQSPIHSAPASMAYLIQSMVSVSSFSLGTRTTFPCACAEVCS